MKDIRWSAVVKGIIFALVITFLFICAASALSYFSLADESVVSVILFAGVMAGVFFGCLPVVRIGEHKKLLNGMMVGIGYLAAITVMSLIMNGGIEFNTHFITTAAGCLMAAFLSAVVFS